MRRWVKDGQRLGRKRGRRAFLAWELVRRLVVRGLKMSQKISLDRLGPDVWVGKSLKWSYV